MLQRQLASALLLGLDGGPVDALGELARSEVDQAAVLDRLVLVVLEREPVDRLCVRVDDQDLVDVVGGVERALLPALVAGGDDLDHERRCGMPGPACAGAV